MNSHPDRISYTSHWLVLLLYPQSVALDRFYEANVRILSNSGVQFSQDKGVGGKEMAVNGGAAGPHGSSATKALR